MINNKPAAIAVLPVHNPEKELLQRVSSILSPVDKLIVINDGSGEQSAEVFSALKQMADVVLLTNLEKRGRGYSLKQGLTYCIEYLPSSDIVITLDDSGSCSLEDIASIYEQARKNPDSLIIGTRCNHNKSAEKTWSSRIIGGMLKGLYGLDLDDPLTPLRAVSVELGSEFNRLNGNHYAYDVAALICAKRKQIPILESKVYTSGNRRLPQHYRLIQDSLLIVCSALRNMGSYIMSSALSAMADVLVFAVLIQVVFPAKTPVNTLLATVIARVTSSLLNFFLNCKVVFHGKAARAIVRYYALCIAQLCCSYGIVYLIGHGMGLPLTPVKVIGDSVLALLSYQIQCRWVYKSADCFEGFYGELAQITRWAARLFSRRYHCDFAAEDHAVVYVCRHLNMHGPYVTLKWLPVQVHPMVLHVFLEKDACYEQFSEYTLPVRTGEKSKVIRAAARMASWLIPPVICAFQAIPVYRNGFTSLKTMKCSLEYLEKEESLIVWPDIEYTAGYDQESEIYRGFLMLGEMYYRRTGRSLHFVPLYIDDEKRCIHAGKVITVNSYKSDAAAAAELIRQAINAASMPPGAH